MKILNLKLKSINNSTMGNPNFEILEYDNQLALDILIKKKYFFYNSKGKLRTKSNISLSYGILNKDGNIVEDILIVAKK